jgi:SAM-dependent methyltransferase
MSGSAEQQAGREWQTGVWDRMSDVYQREIDHRFTPVVDGVITRAALAQGEHVLDLGTGTGSVAERALDVIGTTGSVTAVDISPEMVALAQRRLSDAENATILEGGAETIPTDDGAFHVVLASLSLMYVIDREAAAREIKRVLQPGGRLVAAVWAGPDECDIVLLQSTAGRFAGPPPVPGVGPGALADPTEFLAQLARAGITAHVERETLGFDFPDFDSAWDVLAGVTTANLSEDVRADAQAAVREAMDWTSGPRHFTNTTQFIVGRSDDS